MSPFAGSVASTKRFCVKAYMHRGRHDTRPAAEGKRT